MTDADYIDAKAYLLKTSVLSGGNVYDHLARLIARLLSERPKNALDIFEELSTDLKTMGLKYGQSVDTLVDKNDFPPSLMWAENLSQLIETHLLNAGELPDEVSEEEELELPLKNLMEEFHFFEQAGICLSKEELFRIFLSLKLLLESHNLLSVRFWGKIIGTEKNYIIAEADFREGDEDEDEEEQEPEDIAVGLLDKSEDQDEDVEKVVDIIPQPQYKPQPPVPKEPLRKGCNKKIYYVCNEAGLRWERLPNVLPVHITVARQITKFFTGRLNKPVNSYPPFPGNETNYLRAQIARISAGTHISPIGYYMFDEEEEEEDEDGPERYVINTEYEPIFVKELIDPSMNNWVHHVQHILNQGRCKWVNPVKKSEEEEEEDYEEESGEQEEIQPEIGPPLLTPLSEDVAFQGTPPWTPSLSSMMLKKYALAVVNSNLWPGACAYSDGKRFGNVYIGTGLKFSVDNYNPPPPPLPMEEFVIGPLVSETNDPTVEEEEAVKAALLASQEEEEEEEEEEEDDDDD